MSVLISESKIRKIVRNEIKRLVSESADTRVHIPNIGEVTLEYESTDDKVWRIDFNQIGLDSTAVVFDINGDNAYADEARMDSASKPWKFGWVLIDDVYGGSDDGYAESLQTAARQAYKAARRNDR